MKHWNGFNGNFICFIIILTLHATNKPLLIKSKKHYLYLGKRIKFTTEKLIHTNETGV